MTAIVFVTTSTTTTTTKMNNDNSPIPPPPSSSASSPREKISRHRIIDPITIAATTTQPPLHQQHHDIFLSLTSPALVKKKTTHSIKEGDGERLLTPTSIQLLRNTLTTTNTSIGTMYNDSCNSNRHAITITNTSGGTQKSTTASTYHRLKRLDTEPIITTTTTSLSPLQDNDIRLSSTTTTSNMLKDTSKLISPPKNASNESTTCALRRRKIFGTYWDHTITSGSESLIPNISIERQEQHQQQQQQRSHNADDRRHIRSNSCCTNLVANGVAKIASSPSTTTKIVQNNSTKFVPPPLRLQFRSKSEGFNNSISNSQRPNVIDQQYYKIHINDHVSNSTLLPSPMQRLRKSSGGVYPLVQPKSILRHRSPLQQQFNAQLKSSLTVQDEKDDTTEDDSKKGISFNDVDRASSISSNSSHSTLNDVVLPPPPPSTDAVSSTPTTTTDIRKPFVHFEPRVTITELAERDHERIWYTDTDLNRFKNETVATAKAYLSEHPDMVILYSQPTYDPITKTMRKRALFSMPALADISISEQDDENMQYSNNYNSMERTTITPPSNSLHVTASPQHILSLLAFEDDIRVETNNIINANKGQHHQNDQAIIRRVLIVDHNQWIVDLFVRSVRAMFDIDYNSKKNKMSTSNNNNKNELEIQCAPNLDVAMSIITSASAAGHQPPFDLIIAEQLPHQFTTTSINHTTLMNGDEKESEDIRSSGATTESLFHRIESVYRNQMLLISVVASSSSSLSLKQQLQIRDQTASDFVWGKPPPRMDVHLRTQLIRALQKKREQ